MNELIPTADVLPAAPWIFRALQALVFPIHLLFMNMLLGCAGVALYAGMKGAGPRRHLAHSLARALPVLMAIAANFGVAALLFVQLLWGPFLYTSSILSAVFWVSVIVLLIIAYYALYLYDFRFERLGRLRQVIIFSATVIFLVIPFIFTNNMTLMLNPQAWGQYFENSAGILVNWGDPTLIPRYLHFILGSFAVGGLFVALYIRYRGRHDFFVEEEGVRIGMAWFSWLTLVQVIDGMVFLVLLPAPVQRLLLGGSPHGTGVFLLGFVLAVLALVAGFRGRVTLAAVVVVPLVFVMSEVRAVVRSGYLAPHFSLEMVPVSTQLSPLAMFLVVLVLGAAVISWLLWRCAQALRFGR